MHLWGGRFLWTTVLSSVLLWSLVKHVRPFLIAAIEEEEDSIMSCESRAYPFMDSLYEAFKTTPLYPFIGRSEFWATRNAMLHHCRDIESWSAWVFRVPRHLESLQMCHNVVDFFLACEFLPYLLLSFLSYWVHYMAA